MPAEPDAVRVTRWLAVLGPVLLLAGAGAWLAAPDDQRAPGFRATAAALDLKLAAHPADVVVLGNSKVRSDLVPDTFAGPAGPPVFLGVNGTGAPVWYAILAQRVYAHGYAPRVVVVYATLAMMVQVELPSADQQSALAEELDVPEAAIDAKVTPRRSRDPRVARVLERRTALRRSLTDTWRDLVVGALFVPGGAGDVVTRGRTYAQASLERLFGVDAPQEVARPQVGPIVQRDMTAPTRVVTVGDSLVPDLVTLAAARGSRIVFVRAPLGSAAADLDRIDDDVVRGVQAWLADAGVAWIDLSGAMPDSAFADGVHMTAAGRAAFQPLLRARLQAAGVVD